ncbi:MAG: NnrU family protein [Steroidobacteraceae bacterium]
MWALILGLILFLGVHSIAIFAPGLRERARSGWGEGTWKGVHSLISLLGFVLIIYGFGLARQSPVVLYTPPQWMRHVTALLMLPVFPLLIAAYLPGRIKSAAKHPMLAAVKFWAFAHLLANGMLADVLLFGGFLAWAVLDRISLKKRPQNLRTAPPGRFNDAIAVIAGLALYGLFVGWAHFRLFGVSPFG